MDRNNTIMIIAVSALVTLALRVLPFLIFGRKKQTPPVIARLASALPYAIMGMLVVYCLKDLSAPFGLPELIGCAAVVLLHIWKRSTLLSIGGGTLCYMLLTAFVF